MRREREEFPLQVRGRIEGDCDHLGRGREDVRVEAVDDPSAAAGLRKAHEDVAEHGPVEQPLGCFAGKHPAGEESGCDLFFALIAGDVLYLKADEAARAALEKAGARPFQPFPDQPKDKGRMQYYSVPAAILEDAKALLAWAKGAVAIAGAKQLALD
jgi:hypothetical protein